MKVNPDRKAGVDPQMAVKIDNITETPAVKPAPNLMQCIPLDLVSTVENGIMWCEQRTVSICCCPGICPGQCHSSLRTKGLDFEATFTSGNKLMTSNYRFDIFLKKPSISTDARRIIPVGMSITNGTCIWWKRVIIKMNKSYQSFFTNS